MDRIHRLGQHRPIVVTRLIVQVRAPPNTSISCLLVHTFQNSIESRIDQLQEKKHLLFQGTVSCVFLEPHTIYPPPLRDEAGGYGRGVAQPAYGGGFAILVCALRFL